MSMSELQHVCLSVRLRVARLCITHRMFVITWGTVKSSTIVSFVFLMNSCLWMNLIRKLMYVFGFSCKSLLCTGVARDFPFDGADFREAAGARTSQSLDTYRLPSGIMTRGSDTTLKSRNWNTTSDNVHCWHYTHYHSVHETQCIIMCPKSNKRSK